MASSTRVDRLPPILLASPILVAERITFVAVVLPINPRSIRKPLINLRVDALVVVAMIITVTIALIRHTLILINRVTLGLTLVMVRNTVAMGSLFYRRIPV